MIPDNYSQWEAHERRQERARASLPVCAECDHEIQDEHCYEFNGEVICKHCLIQNHRKLTEYYKY